MKNNIKYLISLSWIILLFNTSCTDLPLQMSGVINPADFPKTEDDAKALVTACYVPFQSNLYNGIFTVNNDGYQIIGDMTTDLGDCQWDNGLWYEAINQSWTPTTHAIIHHYDYVRKLSEFTMVLDKIEKMDSTVMTTQNRKRFIAEVKCARGFMGYLLYNWFGPIPIATVAQLSDPLSTEVVPRPTNEEMFAFIEQNLKEAVSNLDYTYPGEDGTFTKGLANMVLLKLYMHDQKWNLAEAIGRELMDSRYGYSLIPEYSDIFTYNNQHNHEIIYAAGCDEKVQQLWLAHVLPGQYPTVNTNIVKWNGYRVPWNFYTTFQATDKRLKVLVGDFIGTDGIRYWTRYRGNVMVKGVIPVKYGEDPKAIGEGSSIDWIIYRYADALMLTAEAIVRNGNVVTSEAVEMLNKVRVRAGLPRYEITRYSSTGVDGFLADILVERGHELWFEGTRREDLIRFGKYTEYAISKKNSTTAQPYMTLMPIPQWVINEGKGKIKQNPGY